MPETVESLLLCLSLMFTLQKAGSEFSNLEKRLNAVNFQHRPGTIQRTANIGGNLVLDCDVSYPSGQYQELIMTWRKQGLEVPIFIQYNGFPPHIDGSYFGRVRMVEQASLEISDIRTSDEGWYWCSVLFMDGTSDEMNSNINGTLIHLTVYSPPVLGEVSPSFLIQKEGDTIDIFCEASATPEPITLWHKDDKEIVSNDRTIVKDNHVQLNNLQRTDGGVYSCTFQNVVGRVSHEIRLIIKDNVYIMIPPKNSTAVEGSRVKFNCQAEGFPNNISYRWFKNEVDILHVPGLMSRAGIYADGSLIINSVAKDDLAWYECQPTNGLGSAPAAQAFLNVTYLPVVLPMSPRVYLPQGMPGRLDCPVDANPPATRIVWSLNEQIIDIDQVQRVKVSKYGALLIKSVLKEDEGRYTCRPYSPLGSGQISVPVQVLVRDPPYFSLRPKFIYQCEQLQHVELPCAAEGDPATQITWKKVNGALPPSTRTLINGGNLTIVRLEVEDQGTYECIATNVVTSIIATTVIIIELSSHRGPYNVTVETTASSARISWLPAYDSGSTQHYVIWYRIDGSTKVEWQTLQVVPSDALSITVYNLFPRTKYQFMVLSRSHLGDEHFSKQVSTFTKGKSEMPVEEVTEGPSLLPSPPVNVTVVQLPGSLRISWKPPNYTVVPITSYVIEYRTVGQWVPLTGVGLPGNATLYDWRTASRGAVYYFRIISKGQTTSSRPSEVVSFNTGSNSVFDRRMSNSVIGALVTTLFLVLVTVIVVILIVKFFQRRKKHEMAAM